MGLKKVDNVRMLKGEIPNSKVLEYALGLISVECKKINWIVPLRRGEDGLEEELEGLKYVEDSLEENWR